VALAGEPLVLRAGSTVLTVSPADGGRLASLVIDGQERLVAEGYGPIRWGSYPMAPWAGRIRDGRFSFRGRDVELLRNLPPHAIHGTVFERAWTVTGPDSMTIDLGPAWPFDGRVTQRFALDEDGLRVDLELVADEAMPVVVGWHPWFRRPVELSIEPRRMYERGPDGLPTGRLIAPTPRPWDDCLVDLSGPPRLSWPDGLRLEITSSADHWVVYDESEDGVCVEPQTGPPDAINLDVAPVVQPGEPLRAWMAWRWSRGLSASR
jgi:aldose 1-epimerase